MPRDIPANKCTHLVYTFIEAVSGGGLKHFEDAAIIHSMVGLRSQNSKLRVLVAIGGWNAGSPTFSEVYYFENILPSLHLYKINFSLDRSRCKSTSKFG